VLWRQDCEAAPQENQNCVLSTTQKLLDAQAGNFSIASVFLVCEKWGGENEDSGKLELQL
jgi:hypothetical protein